MCGDGGPAFHDAGQTAVSLLVRWWMEAVSDVPQMGGRAIPADVCQLRASRALALQARDRARLPGNGLPQPHLLGWVLCTFLT